MPADEELLGRAPLELHSLGMTCAGGRLEVGFGGLGRPAGVGERVREAFPPCRGGRRSRAQRQSLPVEERGPIEGERRARFRGGKTRLNRRMVVIPGAPIVLEQRLAVVASLLDERLDDHGVDPAHRVGGNLRGEHLANPIVIGLDPLRRAAAANEVGGAEHRNEGLPLALDPARVADELRRHRPAADRQRLEEAARLQ